jgi:hypothetical protein
MKTSLCRCISCLLVGLLLGAVACSPRREEVTATERKSVIAFGAVSGGVLYSEDFESGTGGWTDSHHRPPELLKDASSPAGPIVMSIARTGSHGEYFSPWIALTGGEIYCARAAIKWSGKGGEPRVGIQPSSNASRLSI